MGFNSGFKGLNASVRDRTASGPSMLVWTPLLKQRKISDLLLTVMWLSLLEWMGP